MAGTDTRRDGWRRDPSSGWIAFTLFGAVAFVLLAAVVGLSPSADRVDAALSAAVRSMRTPALTQLAIAATALGSTAVVVGIMVVTTGILAWKKRVAGIVYLLSTVAVGWFLGNVVAKQILHRSRPVGVAIIPLPHDYSFPSAHSLASFLLYASLVVIIMLEAPTGRHIKRWIFAVAVVAIVLVGWSRIYLGVHWFGDVVGAWLLGLAWWSFATATYFGSVRMEARRK